MFWNAIFASRFILDFGKAHLVFYVPFCWASLSVCTWDRLSSVLRACSICLRARQLQGQREQEARRSISDTPAGLLRTWRVEVALQHIAFACVAPVTSVHFCNTDPKPWQI